MQIQQPMMAADAAQLALIKRKMQLEKQASGAANWFFWIAGLSLANSGLYLLGLPSALLFGLGLTQFVDGYITGIIRASGPTWSFLHIIGSGIDLCIAGAFVLIGYFARKRVRWCVRVGMVLYALDGILMLVLKAHIGAAFHVLALLGIWIGLLGMKQLDVLEKPLPGESADALIQRSVASLRQNRKPIHVPWSVIIISVLALLVPFFIFLIMLFFFMPH